MNDNEVFSWQTPEYSYRHKNADWYWAVCIIAVSTIITSAIYYNFLFAVFILLGTICLLYFSSRHPRVITCSLFKNGVSVGGYVYLYKNIKAFWIDEETYEPKLIIHSNRLIMPLVTIPLGNMGEERRDELREKLLKKLSEREMPEPAAQKIMDYLGF